MNKVRKISFIVVLALAALSLVAYGPFPAFAAKPAKKPQRKKLPK